MREIVIGTRGSELALWQANFIKKRLQEELNITSRLEIVKTKGDKILDVPLAKIGGKGLFTKELEELLLQKKIDLAVHSLKDVPVDFIEGLGLACISTREDPRDCFLSVKYKDLQDLPSGAKIGTTSLRRSMQLKALRKDWDTQSLRGNVQTRIRRLLDGDFDAIILAKAALNRLQISTIPFIKTFPTNQMIPAMGQGALGIEARLNEALFFDIQNLNDSNTALCTGIERSFVRTLGGGCQVPIGVYANIQGEEIVVEAILGLPNGERILQERIVAKKYMGEAIGITLAQQFIKKGAMEILHQAQEMVL